MDLLQETNYLIRTCWVSLATFLQQGKHCQLYNDYTMKPIPQKVQFLLVLSPLPLELSLSLSSSSSSLLVVVLMKGNSFLGGTISELVEEKKAGIWPIISEDTCFVFLEDILKGLKFLNGKGLVHRDIKGNSLHPNYS